MSPSPSLLLAPSLATMKLKHFVYFTCVVGLGVGVLGVLVGFSFLLLQLQTTTTITPATPANIMTTTTATTTTRYSQQHRLNDKFLSTPHPDPIHIMEYKRRQQSRRFSSNSLIYKGVKDPVITRGEFVKFIANLDCETLKRIQFNLGQLMELQENDEYSFRSGGNDDNGGNERKNGEGMQRDIDSNDNGKQHYDDAATTTTTIDTRHRLQKRFFREKLEIKRELNQKRNKCWLAAYSCDLFTYQYNAS